MEGGRCRPCTVASIQVTPARRAYPSNSNSPSRGLSRTGFYILTGSIATRGRHTACTGESKLDLSLVLLRPLHPSSFKTQRAVGELLANAIILFIYPRQRRGRCRPCAIEHAGFSRGRLVQLDGELCSQRLSPHARVPPTSPAPSHCRIPPASSSHACAS